MQLESANLADGGPLMSYQIGRVRNARDDSWLLEVAMV
jgi:hypothetical protein